MLAAIARFSVRYRTVVLTLAAALLIYGGATVGRAPIDVFPNFAPPRVSIQTEAPGLTPRQVENLVTRPIEAATSGVLGVKRTTSTSFEGLSLVRLVFADGTDIFQDRQLVAAQLANLQASLPAGVHAPTLGPLNAPARVVMVIGLTDTSSSRSQRSLQALRTLADWTVKPRLEAVPGVSSVTVYGGLVEELQIQPETSRMRLEGVSLAQLVKAARGSTGVRGGGFAVTPNQRVMVQVKGQPGTPGQLAQVLVRRVAGVPVRIGDVARVVRGSAPPRGAASVDGKPAVILMLDNQLGSNTVAVTHRLDKALDDLGPALAAAHVKLHRDLFRPAQFVRTAVNNVNRSLEVGAVLVTLVLLAFLFNLRTSLISLAAIPLSLLAAVAVLMALGVSLNTMTLGGLALAIGEVVDDAVIDVENIFRRIKENPDRPVSQVILEASVEVRGAVVYATFVVILVFVPILMLSGLEGRLFAPLATAYIAAVLASLGVALTVTPALASVLLKDPDGSRRASPVLEWLLARYTPLLQRVLRRPGRVWAMVMGLVLAALAVFPFLGQSFIPKFQEDHLILHMVMAPGTSLAQSMAMGRKVTRLLLRDPAVKVVSQRAGRARRSDDVATPAMSEFDVQLGPHPGKSSTRVQAELLGRLSNVPGAVFGLNPFLTERIGETMSGFGASVVVRIFGPHLGALDRLARQVVLQMKATSGAINVSTTSPLPAPRLVVRLEPHRLLAFGLRPMDVIQAVHTAWQGVKVAQVYRDGRVIQVRVIQPPSVRNAPGTAAKITVDTPAGVPVPVSAVARLIASPARSTITHVGGRRCQVVSCDVQGPDVGSFTSALEARLKRLKLPPGTYLSMAGAARARHRAMLDLARNCLLAAVGIVLLVMVAVRGSRNRLLVLLNLPFSLVGGVVAVLLLGGTLGLGGAVGFVAVFGITTRNALMLMSHYEHLVAVEGADWGWATALRGARERFGPIVMTAVVTGLGLLPMALGAGAAGREIDGPMASVILGGLVSSTTLTLLVLPTLSLRYGRFGRTEP